MKPLDMGETFVVFGGRIRRTKAFASYAEAEEARGGTQCWLVTGRSAIQNNAHHWETLIVKAVRREERSGRVYYTWADETGCEHIDHGSRRDSYETFADAKASLIKSARDSLKSEQKQVVAQRQELARMRALKPLRSIVNK